MAYELPYEDPYELVGWQGEGFDFLPPIEGVPVVYEEEQQQLPPVVEPNPLWRRAAYYAGQAGAGLLLAGTVPFAVPIALAAGYAAEQGLGGEAVQKVTGIAAKPGTWALGLLDSFQD